MVNFYNFQARRSTSLLFKTIFFTFSLETEVAARLDHIARLVAEAEDKDRNMERLRGEARDFEAKVLAEKSGLEVRLQEAGDRCSRLEAQLADKAAEVERSRQTLSEAESKIDHIQKVSRYYTRPIVRFSTLQIAVEKLNRLGRC
jgi:septal ring factor EnvC (AmiA/AmiB activator)